MPSNHFSQLKRSSIVVALTLLICGAAAVASADQPQMNLHLAADGSDLLYQGEPVRLYGIYFPNHPGVCNETLTGCRDLGLAALSNWLAKSGPVTCDVLVKTSNGTQVARCRQDQIDLGAWLVGHGYALADRRAGRGYLRDEQSARGENAGLWGSESVLAQF